LEAKELSRPGVTDEELLDNDVVLGYDSDGKVVSKLYIADIAAQHQFDRGPNKDEGEQGARAGGIVLSHRKGA
jgi:hypothetical protein